MRDPYKWRGDVPLAADDHEFWELVQKRVAQRKSWESIAIEIGCNVDDLIHWANWVYQPPKKVEVSKPNPNKIYRGKIEDIQVKSPVNLSRQFLAWKKAKEGARETREAMQA